MASEILSVPEDSLGEFCELLEAGIRSTHDWSPEMVRGLQDWITEVREYLSDPGDD